MADTSFPARITMTREPDVDGLPILTAQVELAHDVAGWDLPPGPAGPQGLRGRPRTTFRKIGEIPNAGARPAGLGDEDRGKWWHRLDDNGMDVWTGTGWQHSPQAVGPQGPMAKANTITAVTQDHKENLTVPAVEFTGKSADQQLKVTVPAGLPGPRGPAGASGELLKADDFDATTGPVGGGVFAYNRAARKFRPTPPPMGSGPWSWYSTDFADDQESTTAAELIAGTFTVPAQTFTWRPRVNGHIYTYAQVANNSGADAVVRLNSSEGEVLAATTPAVGGYLYLPLISTYRDDQATKALSPSSTFATIPPGQPATFVVSVRRRGSNSSSKIGFNRSRASLVIYAEPF
ncbi:hypothetical protein [Nocardia sp. NPDC020380]|uniref:hypothetical protein n=1 Tax=Nocardia sp. NPDC020380 TaxID=3364309 RepID=UPI003793AB13